MLDERLARRHITSQSTKYKHVQYSCGGVRGYSGCAAMSGIFFCLARVAARSKRVVNGCRLLEMLSVSKAVQQLDHKQDHEHLESFPSCGGMERLRLSWGGWIGWDYPFGIGTFELEERRSLEGFSLKQICRHAATLVLEWRPRSSSFSNHYLPPGQSSRKCK
jgi:hypothetical protein